MAAHVPTWTLPVELWAIILGCLPRADQRNCLFVSRSLHDLARSIVFHRSTICLGVWNGSEIDPWDITGDCIVTEEQIEHQATVAWQMLRQILRDSVFAAAIKHLCVRAYCDGSGHFELPFSDMLRMFDCVFLEALADALGSLTNLLSLTWEGESPMVNRAVLDAVSSMGEMCLTELHIPMQSVGAMVSSTSPFPRFDQLRSLSLTSSSWMDAASPAAKLRTAVCSSVESCCRTLERLYVCSDAIWSLPVRSFLNLRDLTICHPETLGGLNLVLHHSSQLRALALILRENPIGLPNSVFAPEPDAVPRLSSFKLICVEFAFISDIPGLVSFLRGKKDLRRIDVDLNSPHDLGSFPPPTPLTHFFDLLSALPKLEIVGLSMSITSPRADFELLDERLPLSATALLIKLNFSSSAIPATDWIDLIRKRRSLRYLHIIDLEGTMDLKQQLLEDHPDSLELVGYGPHLRWLERDPETGAPAYSPRWPAAKVRFRTAQDFGSVDWEWLLRFHGW
ncbi:hypothetical protein BD413DRAFT_644816 [Trametes elegans]|nr:hypothetical protein BD413DRAFT_644816 [Trametes elegans]